MLDIQMTPIVFKVEVEEDYRLDQLFEFRSRKRLRSWSSSEVDKAEKSINCSTEIEVDKAEKSIVDPGRNSIVENKEKSKQK